MSRVFKYKIQELDNRDFKYTKTNQNNKNTFELKMPIIYNQEALGSCVSNAIALYIYYLLKINPSRLYIYFNGRAVGNYNLNEDTGLNIRDGCKSIQKYFITNEANWPYNINNFSQLPDFNAYNNAIKFSDMKYYSVNQDITAIKACLNNNLPVIFGIAVYSSFNEAGQTGIVSMPNINLETLIGYHCILIVGYDENNKKFKCANSWGTNWGINGYFYLSYEYILDTNLSFDFWCIVFNRFNKNNKKKNNYKLLLLHLK
jgi:hypothetical protein